MFMCIYLRETNGKKYANWFNLNIQHGIFYAISFP